MLSHRYNRQGRAVGRVHLQRPSQHPTGSKAAPSTRSGLPCSVHLPHTSLGSISHNSLFFVAIPSCQSIRTPVKSTLRQYVSCLSLALCSKLPAHHPSLAPKVSKCHSCAQQTLAINREALQTGGSQLALLQQLLLANSTAYWPKGKKQTE